MAEKKKEPKTTNPTVKGKKEPVKATEKAETKDNGKAYHLSKRTDGKWQVKYAGGQVAIKLFNTKEDALEYTKNMAKNQGRAILVHASKGPNKGKLRKK